MPIYFGPFETKLEEPIFAGEISWYSGMMQFFVTYCSTDWLNQKEEKEEEEQEEEQEKEQEEEDCLAEEGEQINTLCPGPS